VIVIPMAGLSQRFLDAGYSVPKYMLPLGPSTVFDRAVGSFRKYFKTEKFLFVARDVQDTLRFVQRSCFALGVDKVEVVALDKPTAGQAETVEIGLFRANVRSTEPITIFNIDTFRPDFCFPRARWWEASDGYLEVFRGSGGNWSYVRPSTVEEGRAIETAEKKPISDLCCTGLYHFANSASFHDALAAERLKPQSSELYVAPLYNCLIANGLKIHYDLIQRSKVIFCGVPAEYESLMHAPEV
jgi:hypothetical protein